MIPDGIYRFYKVRFDEAGQPHQALGARILIHGGQIQHLEDHGGFDDLLPEGPVTPKIERRFKQLSTSGYHRVVHEGDMAEGHHSDLLEPVEIGPIEAEHKFIMTGDGVANPAVLEMWDHAVMVDGRRLDDGEAQSLLNEVAAGRVILTPLDG